jgi:hypothetical protein
MKNSLRRLTVLVSLCVARAALAVPAVVAATPASPPEVPVAASSSSPTAPRAADGLSAGDRLLVEAGTRLERRPSVTARLRHQTLVNGQQLYGVGSYWQQGSGDDLRVRLELQIGREISSSQISNGRFLWLDRVLPTGRTVTRIDLRKLRSDPVLAAAQYEGIRPGQANWSPAQDSMISQCGGVPRLIVSLRDNFTFYPPQAMRLVAPEPGGAASQPYFAVVGRWKNDKFTALVGGQQSGTESQAQDATTSVPDRLPQEVLLLFGQADLFPYRIEYRRFESSPVAGPNVPPPVYQLSNRPTAVLEFSDVAFDVPIAPSQFDYVPPNVDWVDHTAALIEKLRRERQQDVAARSDQEPFTQPVR